MPLTLNESSCNDFVEDLRGITHSIPFSSLYITLNDLIRTENIIRLESDLFSKDSDLKLTSLESSNEEIVKKADIHTLLKEKLYLQDRRLRKYKDNSRSLGYISKILLKDLLKDCDHSDWNKIEDENNIKTKIQFLDKNNLKNLALRKWKIDGLKSSGNMSIPGLLSIRNESDFEILDYNKEKISKESKSKYLQKLNYLGRNYELNLIEIPKISTNFESINFGDSSFEVELRTHKSKGGSSKYRGDRRNGKDSSKSKKSENQLIRTARMSNYDKKRVKVARNECFTEFTKIERKISDKRQKALVKISSLNKIDLEKYKKKGIIKVWSGVCASVVKIQKFFQKDSEQNAKKLGVLCAKERRKMLAKTKKNVKDYVLRAKRLNKEVIVYWKRRGKELNDLRKKREKIKSELKKKDEEKKEQRKQKRKIEYLIKQSDIYAHIMAQKLGINQKKSNNIQPEKSLLTKEDVKKAENSINGIIKKNQERVNTLHKEMTKHEKSYSNEINGNICNNNNKKPNDDVNFDFSKIELDEKSSLISTPASFKGKLKEYQLKGLRWLNNLFEQGINGILADEMGLGKTVQAIALMTHIAEIKNCWGPFLVIAPTITLFNWQSECAKFSPKLKILPYWGSKKDREVLRKSFRQNYFGKLESSSHIVITSYSFAVRDFKYLDRLKWQYIILDEAQAIKNIRSQRWSTLLSLKSRNKLLLTGTPIQNTMAELWALLHFIMPQLFDSHEEFQEWFSKDIEAHSKNKHGYLNKTQLNRLHAILKPFMLRRVKKDVEKEIGKKIVTELICEMSARQKLLYNNIKRRICLSDLMQMYENKQKTQNLMNLVMQFRKVCNHPELFERKIEKTSVIFSKTLENNLHFIYNKKPNMKFLILNDYDHPFRLYIPSIIIM